MKITDIRVNGIKSPVGFAFPRIKCSWKVTDTADKMQEKARIHVSLNEDMEPVYYTIEAADLSQNGTCLDMHVEPCTRYYFQIEVWGEEGDYGISGIAYFETGKMDELWEAEFISTREDDLRHPVFWKSFTVPDKISRARLYITGLGVYEAYLNGQKIGDDFLAPFCNDYNKHVQYQTYDITPLLEQDNELGVMTGNGWYKGRLGYSGEKENFGNRFGIIAELHLYYEDGRKEVIPSDSSWSYCASDIAASDLYDGEVIDRMLWQNRENERLSVEVLEFDKTKLIERYSIPVLVKDEIAVKEVIETPVGETVLDMGQNFTGYVTFLADFAAGTKVVLDFGEILQNGCFYNDNYRTAKSQFTYIANGKKEWVRPHFTFFGFRYVRVSGWPGELMPENFKGQVVYSDLDSTCELRTSSKQLNQLASNAQWGQRSNFLDMPTDCPQRDERLGWTGDAQVFAGTACFQMDTRAFYRKFLFDLHLEQQDNDGAVANYLPNIAHMPGGSSVWGDAATFIPMTLYSCYGDSDELADYYPMMKEWVDYIIRQDRKQGERHLWDFGFHFGDWLAQDGITSQSMKGGTDDGFIASMYYYASVQKTKEAAKIIGKSEEAKYYQKKAADIYQAILDEYFAPSGRLVIDTQTGYLLALRFKVYRNKESIVTGLRKRLKKDCYKIKGGFVGAPMMCQVLAENGLEEEAYYILFQQGFPGWMYCVNLGATTIWERWNSVLPDGTISGTDMNSLNHYAYGAVMEYVYRYIAGINEIEPGFRKVRFAPQLNSKLEHVYFAYDSINGKYVSQWQINHDGSISVHFEVPFGCSAVVIYPGTNGREEMLLAGVYEKTYYPNKDFRLKYTMQSRLEEMTADPAARAILKEHLPLAEAMIAKEDIESMNLCLEELKTMFFMGFNPEMVDAAAKKLLKLKRE